MMTSGSRGFNDFALTRSDVVLEVLGSLSSSVIIHLLK